MFSGLFTLTWHVVCCKGVKSYGDGTLLVAELSTCARAILACFFIFDVICDGVCGGGVGWGLGGFMPYANIQKKQSRLECEQHARPLPLGCSFFLFGIFEISRWCSVYAALQSFVRVRCTPLSFLFDVLCGVVDNWNKPIFIVRVR